MRTALLWLGLTGLTVGADILAFTREGCGPCEKFKSDYAKNPSMVHPHKLHLRDLRSELAQSYGITSVPTFIKLKDGKEIGRKTGYGEPDGLKQWANRP